MADARSQPAYGEDVVPELPGYRIERQLGRGSMGVVYLAEDVQLHRKVAVKILTPNLGGDELFRKRFDRESQSAANLDHPNIVPVYAAGAAGGLLYIAMRYVGGGDLRMLLDANGPLNLEQATSIVASVAAALDAAHAQGMIHRDVKPANILIDESNGQAHYYLSDFSIAKIVSSDRSLTSVGQIVGTIDYMAPEQIQGKPVDGRTDLYALGCVLYQCLTGTVPFVRDIDTARMWAHVNDEVSPISPQRPDLPPQIDVIVAKAMAKQPEDRYATCRELAAALRALAADPAASQVGTVSPTGPLDRPAPPVSTGMTSTYTPPTPPPVKEPVSSSPPSRRWRWLTIAGVLVLVLIGGSVGVIKYLNSRYPNAAERELLLQVPPSLRNSCDRKAEPDAATIVASVTCTFNGEGPNTVDFTKFTSAQALDNHYHKPVTANNVVSNTGDCFTTDRAEGAYTDGSGRMSGRKACYQELGSAVVAWTDGQTQTLGMATRVDGDYLKVRDWWATVMGLPTRAQLAAEAKASQEVAAANQRVKDAEAEKARTAKELADTKEQQAEKERNQEKQEKDNADKASKEKETQAAEERTRDLERRADAANKDLANAEANRAKIEQQAAAEAPKPTQSEAQQPTRSGGLQAQGPVVDLDGGQRGRVSGGQPSLSSPRAPTQPTTSSAVLSGPAPTAPAGQQGGSPVPGTGGCIAAAGFYVCTLSQEAPGYLPGATEPRGVLRNRQVPLQCQSNGSTYSVGNRAYNWWAWRAASTIKVWVPTAFLVGETDNGPVPGLPLCDGANSATNSTEQSPNQSGPLVMEDPPAPTSQDDNPPN